MLQRRTNTCDCFDDLILFLGHSLSPSLSHLHSILEGQSALWSIASFYDIVHGLRCCNSAELCLKWFDLCSTEDYLCVSQRLTWATTSTLCCYTSFNTSCLVLVPYDHSHKCTQIHHTLVATGSLLGRYHVLLTEIVGGLIQKSTLRTIWERKLGKTYFVALYSTEWPYTVYCYCDFHNTSIHYTLESICSPFLPRANNWLIWNLIYRKSSLYYCCCIIHSLLWCIFSCIQL